MDKTDFGVPRALIFNIHRWRHVRHARNVYKNNESRLDGEGGHPTARTEQSRFFISTMAPSSSSYSPSLDIIVLLYLFLVWKIISSRYSVWNVSTIGDHGSPMCLRLLDLIRVNKNRWRIVRNIKITKITNHKWNHRLSLVVRMERGRTLQLEQHCRHCQEKFDKRHRELAFLSALHSHPFSLIMWASSIMNFPSLYFWLDSNACSWKYHRTISVAKKHSFIRVISKEQSG